MRSRQAASVTESQGMQTPAAAAGGSSLQAVLRCFLISTEAQPHVWEVLQPGKGTCPTDEKPSLSYRRSAAMRLAIDDGLIIRRS